MSNNCCLNIKLLYFNVRSLLPKIDNLRTICNLYSPDIVCIVETWLDNTILDSEVAIQGYSLCRLDHSRHGGGVLIYVKTMFNYSLLFKGTPEFECLFVEVKFCNSLGPEFTVALFYRPPNSGHSPLESLFTTLCNVSALCLSKLFLVGDFNVDFSVKMSPLYNKLLSISSSFNLTQIVSEPTRVSCFSKTLIDLIFVSSINCIQSCTTVPPLANADHYGLQLIFSIASSRTPSETVPRNVWRYHLADWDKAAELLDSIEWDSLLSLDVDEQWVTWKNYFLQIMELCIPHTIAKVKKNLPWINKRILNTIKKRDALFRVAKSTGRSLDRSKYNQKRNLVVGMLRESKHTFFNQRLNNADCKTFWKTIRLLNHDYSSHMPTLQDGTKTIETSLDKATALNNYFYSCFNHSHPILQNTQHLIDTSLPPSECPSELLCTEETVLELLTTLDTTKSTGIDGISSIMLKYTSVSVADSLHKLFNHSISTGMFPSDWKLARITPIPKGTNKSLLSGYRPISVLPVVSKLIERHVKEVIEDYLKANSPISVRQWGFMSNRSTVSALIKVVEDWSSALDKGYEVCVVFFDVSKAFDTVPHSLLLAKLNKLGIDRYLLRWIKNYLTDRAQCVCVNGVSSPSLPVASGVPQGSVLGPLLFIAYINDVAECISPNSDVNMFADDIALYRVIKTVVDYAYLQQDIDSISACIQQKGLNFNTSKCKMMFISKRRSKTIPPPELVLNGTILDRVNSYKYLGITITSDLSWSSHISNCCNKTRRLVGLLYRRFQQHSSPTTLLRLYCSFIRPHLEYASIVWNPYQKGDIAKLEDVQKFSLRVCFKSWDKSYDELLLNSRLQSLQKRRVVASLCHLFKIIKGITEFNDPPLQFQGSSYSTRLSTKSGLTFTLPKSRTNIYRHSFFSNILYIWNSLPREATECNTVETFKKYIIASL